MGRKLFQFHNENPGKFTNEGGKLAQQLERSGSSIPPSLIGFSKQTGQAVDSGWVGVADKNKSELL